MRERTCTICGYTETETIDAMPDAGGSEPDSGQDDPAQGGTGNDSQDDPIQADTVKGDQNAQATGGAAGDHRNAPAQSGKTNTEAPRTGESNAAEVYSAAVLLAGAGLVFCLYVRRS